MNAQEPGSPDEASPQRAQQPAPEPLAPEPLARQRLPADPVAYDSPRATQARARGLAAPYIAGGEDPNPEQTRKQEGRYLRLLVIMIVVLILAGFVLGIGAKLLGLDFLLGNPS